VLVVLLTLVGVPLILLNTSYFQQKVVDSFTKALEEKTGAKIYIEDSDISLFRGIVFHHVQINDSINRPILKAERLDIGVRLLPLLSRRVEVDALRFIRSDLRLSRKTPDSELNIQPIIRAFTKKKKKKSVLPWHVDFTTILFRHSRIRYDVLSEFRKSRGIDVNHLDFSDLSAKLSLKIAPKNHYQFWVYKFNAEEKCGLKLDNIRLDAKFSEKGFNLKDLEIRAFNSILEIPALEAKYKGLSAFSHFADSVRFEPAKIRFSIIPSDFTCLNASLSNLNKPVDLVMAVQGRLSELTCSQLHINMEDLLLLDARITLNGLPKIQNLFMKGQVEMLHIAPEGVEYLSGALTNHITQIQILRNLGSINYMGRLNTLGHKWILTGDLATSAGNVGTNLQLSQKNKVLYYEGKIKTDAFRLDVLKPENKLLGEVAFDVTVKGAQDPKNGATASIDGVFPHFFYNGYDYENLTLKGSFNKKEFKGNASLDDDNAKLLFSGLANLSSKFPKFKFDLYAQNVNLKALNLSQSTVGQSSVSFNMHSDFQGKTIDDILGKVSVDSLSILNNREVFHLRHLDLVSEKTLAGKHIQVSSELLNGEIWGNYQFSTLVGSIKNIVRPYFPSLIPASNPTLSNNIFDFHCTMEPSPEFSTVLNLPVVLEDKLDLRGTYNDMTGKFRLRADVPAFTYGKSFFQSASLLFENPQKEAKFLVSALMGTDEKEMKLNLDARSVNDRTTLKLNVSNSAVNTYSGNLQTDLQFARRTDGELMVHANLQQSDIIVNDSVWHIKPTSLNWESNRLHVEDFQLTHAKQYIKLQGFVSPNSSDTLSVQMNAFSLDDLFQILPKNKSGLHFGGLVTGQADLVRTLKDPSMDADLSVENFSFNHTIIGNLTAKSKWNNSIKALALDALIRSNEEVGGVHRKVATASGAFFPSSDSLFLSIVGDKLPLGCLEPYVGNILYKLDGKASGNVFLIGPVKHLGIYAKAYVEDASFGVEMLNTRYYFSDSILVSPRRISFRNVKVKDKEGNVAIATGRIDHNHFKNMQTDIKIQAKNILAMDLPTSPNAYFYGTAYGSGSVNIYGEQGKMNIDVNLRTEDKTKAVISFLDNSEVQEYSFINFIQKKKPNEDYNFEFKKRKPLQQVKVSAPSNLTVNLQVEATPNAEVTLITDPSSGDEIKARGNGAIRAVFKNGEDMQLFGRYTIENGSYKFIYENILRRDFTIENGGSINFSGNPFAAELDIKANYTVNANLSDLLATEDINYLNLNRTSIPVNCVLKLNGELQKPGIQLDLDYPSADDELKRQIANVINTDEMMNQQIVFLMLFGRFSTPTYSTAQNQSTTSSMSTVLNTTISTVSAQLNNMINDVFGQSKMSFAFDYRSAAYDVNTPGEWKVGMSGQWLDNRLTFTGNLGSRENLTQSNQSQFIGEFDVNLKFKNSEKWSAKFYNKANDNRYFKSALNTQGIGIVYKENYNNFSDLLHQMVETIKRPFRKKEKTSN